MALCEVRLGKLKAPSCNLYCSSSYTKRNRIGTSGEAAWCPPNFEMIGLAMAMKMQTKRHLLSSRCVSFKNTFLASPRSPPFFEDKSPAFIHSLFQQGNGTNNNPKGQAKKIPYAGTPREGNGRAAKYTQTRLHRIDGFRASVHSVVHSVAAW